MTSTAIKTIHTGFRAMGLTDDDDKRAFYMRVVGQSSLKVMSDQQHQRIIEEQRRQGFKPSSKGKKKRLEGKFAPKMQALWIAGYNLGVVTNGSDEALIAFVSRQTGLDHVRFLHHLVDADKAIEGLKQWLSRVAEVDWKKDPDLPKWANQPHGQIVIAQWKLLNAAGQTGGALLAGTAWTMCGYDGKPRLNDLTVKEWHTVMNGLGERIRGAKP